MPTGYTADIYDNKPITFETFVLQCSRAFGATIMQRDEPMSEPPRLRTVDVSYHEKAIAEAQKDLAEALGWTEDEAERLAAKKYSEALIAEVAQNERTKELRTRYTDMLNAVRAWAPPTKDHVKFKEFMIEQLEESIKFDCHDAYPPVKMSGEEYKNMEISTATRSITYYTEQRQQQIASTNTANKWITDLYNSLEN